MGLKVDGMKLHGEKYFRDFIPCKKTAIVPRLLGITKKTLPGL
jgi:hypothetical protein